MRALRAIAALSGVVLALSAVFLWLVTRTDVSTRAVCVDGQVCTERFRLKDGLPVETVCPSAGHERYPLAPGCARSGGACDCR